MIKTASLTYSPSQICSFKAISPDMPTPATGMENWPEDEADPVPVLTREQIGRTVRGVVESLGGTVAVARRLGVCRQTVYTWMTGQIILPSKHAKRLQGMSQERADVLLAALGDLQRYAAYSRGRELEIRRAARQRYYERFGRYPVPARGGKTP